MTDEIPGAYKDIDAVMENQSDLVDIVHTLKQVVCVRKASDIRIAAVVALPPRRRSFLSEESQLSNNRT